MKTPHSEGTALITGASSGFGYQFAKLFAKDNYDLVLVARDKEKLQELATYLQKEHDIFVRIIAKDLSDIKSGEEIYTELQEAGIEIDILVNNAGYATHGEFTQVPLQEEISEIQLNLMTLTILSKLFLKDMLKRKDGKILNIASTAAFFPGPYMAVYYATKAYVLSFSESLAEETSGTGVTVTALCPGPSKTGFATRANVGNTLFFKNYVMDAQTVAQIGYKAMMDGKRVVLTNASSKFGVAITRLVPRTILAKIVKRGQK
jgi:short-subunit dehydrogenase